MKFLVYALAVLAFVHHATAECQCGDDENPGMVQCMKGKIKGKIKGKMGKFLEAPPNCDDPLMAKNEILCDICKPEFDAAKDDLAALRDAVKGCVEPKKGLEVINAIQECARPRIAAGCRNPSGKARILGRFIDAQKEKMKEKCMGDDDDDDDDEEERPRGRFGFMAGIKKRLFGDCNLKKKKDEIKKKLHEKYPSLNDLKDCKKRNKDVICGKMMEKVQKFTDDCVDAFGCTKDNAYGAMDVVLSCGKQNIDPDQIKETIKEKCMCFAKAADIENPEEFCSCEAEE